MFYHFKIHHDSDGLWAEGVELKGCMTQAGNMKKLKKNLEEALNLFLDEPENSKTVFPFPSEHAKLTKNMIKVKVDPQIAFAFYLRMLRLQHHFTQKQVAQKLAMGNLYSYQRLESSKKSNPELKTLGKIKEVFPEFDVNLVL